MTATAPPRPLSPPPVTRAAIVRRILAGKPASLPVAAFNSSI